VRNADNLIVERALDDLPGPNALALLQRLTAAMAGRGLLVVVPEHLGEAAELFDEVVAFKAGKVVAPPSLRLDGSTVSPSPTAGFGADRAPEPAWSPR
jgi:hypothetical protein